MSSPHVLRRRLLRNESEEMNRSCSGSSSETTINDAECTDNTSPILVPQRNLKVYICTWNVNGKNPDASGDAGDALFDGLDIDGDKSSTNMPDICVFGFQEVNSKPWRLLWDYLFDDPWTSLTTTRLARFDFVRLESTRLIGNLLVVFVKRSLLPYVKCCASDRLRLGLWGMWGNKGVNIVDMNIGTECVCLVNSHLAAHEHNEKLRAAQLAQIMSHQIPIGNQRRHIIDQDVLFLFGDLNSRTSDMTLEQCMQFIDQASYDKLLERDQLTRAMAASERSSKKLHEATIRFAPTYKFTSEHEYDTRQREKRLPSYCDRILFSVGEARCYASVSSVRLSDHKPVHATFDVSISDWTSELQRVEFMNIGPSDDECNLDVYYRVHRAVCTHPNDWIGIYHCNFRHVKDYRNYIYATRIKDLENQQINTSYIDLSKNIEEQFVQSKAVIAQGLMEAGCYVLCYVSVVANQIIGASSPFELKFS